MLYNETVHKMFTSLMERFDKMERAFERMNKLKDCLDGDTLLDNYDLCRLLGVIRYYMIDGRTYYKASEIQEFLQMKGKSLPAAVSH